MTRESEPTPNIPEVQTALDQTLRWLNDWQKQIKQRCSFNPKDLENDRDGEIFVESSIGDKTLYSWQLEHNLDSNFGKVSVLHLERMTEDPSNPLMTRLFYKKEEPDELVAVSLGWRFSESEVIYNMLSISNGNIDKLITITHPNVLFPLPKRSPFTKREFSQKLELEFKFSQRMFEEWVGYLGLERKGTKKAFYRNGILVGTGFLQPDGNIDFSTDKDDLNLTPDTLNPILHIENFANRKVNPPLHLI